MLRQSRFLIVFVGLLAACNTGAANDSPPAKKTPDGIALPADGVYDGPEIDAALKGGRPVSPREFVDEQPLPRHTVTSLDDTRSLMADDSMKPLADALKAAGYDDEEIANMVYMAGATRSGSKADSFYYRHKQIKDGLDADLSKFRKRLASFEKRYDVRFDLKAMHDRGIYVSFDGKGVIQ